MCLAPAEKLCGGTQEVVLQQKAINPVSRFSFVVLLILAGGQMIENCSFCLCGNITCLLWLVSENMYA